LGAVVGVVWRGMLFLSEFCIVLEGGDWKGTNGKNRRDLITSGSLTLDGRLHVKGDMTVKGNVTLQPGSELIVDGKRTIHGSLKQLETRPSDSLLGKLGL